MALMLTFSICLGLVAANSSISSSTTPIPPSQDPWYTAPHVEGDEHPGDILKIRPAPGNLTALFPNSASAFNILYRTTNSQYQPSWAVTTLFVPKASNNTSLLSYQIPYDSACVDASPSYALYAPASASTRPINADIETALGLGWYVNVPDFEGPLAAFTAGVQSGFATIDSIRATLQAGTDLSTNASVALWGYSGGTIGSEWAAELQPAYAPELQLRGVAAGGVIANVSAVLQTVPSQLYAVLFPESLVGMTAEYPQARAYLLSQLYREGQYNRTTFLSVAEKPIAQVFDTFTGQNVYKYLKVGRHLWKAPSIQDMLQREGYMGFHGIPQTPLFFYQAIQDEISNITHTDALVQRYCDAGTNLLYERNTIGGHLAEMTNGHERALSWLAKILASPSTQNGCTIRDVTINITDSPV